MGDGRGGSEIITWEDINEWGKEVGTRVQSEFGNGIEGLGQNVQTMLEDELKEIYRDIAGGVKGLEGVGQNVQTMLEDKLKEIYTDIAGDVKGFGKDVQTKVVTEWTKVEIELTTIFGGECQDDDECSVIRGAIQ